MIIHEKFEATELVEVGSGPERSKELWPFRKTTIDDASVVPSEDSAESDNADVDEPGKLRRGVVLILLLLPVVLSVAIYAGVQAAAKSRTGQVNAPMELSRVRVGVTKVGTIASPELLIRFRGVVAPRRESSLSFRRSGPVQNVFVDSGDHLKAGAMIAELDIADLIAQAELADSELEMAVAQFDEAIVGPRKQTIQAAEARVDQLQAQLNASSSRLKRRQQLFAANAVSAEELEDEKQLVRQLNAGSAEAESQLRELLEGTRSEQVKAAKARVDMAKASRRLIDVQQQDSRILAPFDCVIGKRLIDEGTIASPNQAIVTIIEQPPLEAVFGVPAPAASSMKIGEMVLISIGKDADSASEMSSLDCVRSRANGVSAKVVRMQPNVDAVTRTREVVVRFETQEISLVGQPATLWLSWLKLQSDGPTLANASRELWVPSDALVRSVRGLWAIYVLSESKVEPSVEFPNADSELNGKVELYDAKILQTAGPMTKISANVRDTAFIITEGTHRVGPGVEVIGVELQGTSKSEIASTEQTK